MVTFIVSAFVVMVVIILAIAALLIVRYRMKLSHGPAKVSRSNLGGGGSMDGA